MELSTVLFEIDNVLNDRPSCFMYDDNVPEVLTPNSLLYNRKLEFVNKSVDEGSFEVAEGNGLWLKNCAVQKVVEIFSLMWHQEYLDDLTKTKNCRKAGKGASNMGDVVVINKDAVPRHRRS